MAKQKKAKKAKPEKLAPWQEFLKELNPECLTCDDFDEAIIGYVERCGSPPLVCYDAEKMAEIFMRDNKCSYEEAMEYLNFNTFGAYVGEHTPMFFYKFPEGSEPPGLQPKPS